MVFMVHEEPINVNKENEVRSFQMEWLPRYAQISVDSILQFVYKKTLSVDEAIFKLLNQIFLYKQIAKT